MLARTHRFHGYNALNFVHRQGRVVRGQSMSLKYIVNTRRDTYRVAVVVSKKVAKSAVLRNRIRRRIFEAVRTQPGTITKPYDLVFMVYDADLAAMDAEKLRKTVAGHLRKAGVVL